MTSKKEYKLAVVERAIELGASGEKFANLTSFMAK